jgi:hypothetical protein
VSRVSLLVLVVSLTLVAQLGCGRPDPAARMSDSAKAREVLVQALDGWKKGETLQAFQGANPAITVVERQWQAGAKLLDYEIAGDGQPVGFDIQFTVTLKTQEGKRSSEKATYIVSTNPKLVVIRSEAGG